ncbi:hypothetical protein EPN87_01205 [archaeon]|nr:MAG: hypothetical protein EPN87_01205 [archaeon]
MKKIILVFASILVVALALYSIFNTTKKSVPITDQWVDQKLVEWKPNGTTHAVIGGVLDSVSYGHVGQSYVINGVIAENVRMLAESNMSVIRIDMNYGPWLENNTAAIKKYDFAVDEIRRNGKELMIADAAAESYRTTRKVTWGQFKKEWIERVSVLAARYKPDYYVVVKEPGWYWLMPSDAIVSQPWTKLNDWVNLTEDLIKTVKEASPSTKVAIATPGNTLYHDKAGDIILNYYKAATKMEGLDIIGTDNYGVRDFEDTERFLNETSLNGKQFWLLETWSGTAINSTYLQDPSRENLDAKFARAATYFTEKFGGKGVVFFYTRYLASYGDQPENASLVDFYKNRTEIFYEVQRLSRAEISCAVNTTNQICTAQYNPVCGWFDPAKIQCIRYPCAQTFSNSCFACSDDKVKYYTQGECPA